jgi:diguanylate cyclase (GGDEF)-like protein
MKEILNKQIAVCISRVSEESHVGQLIILHNVARKYGCKLVIFSTSAPLNPKDSTYNGDCSIFENICFDKFDAVICFAEAVHDERILRIIADEAKRVNIPIVTYDKYVDGCINIKMDYKSSFEKLVRHIIEDHGCKVVDYVSGMPNNEFSQEREEIFKSVLRENGIKVEERRIGYGWFWEGPTKAVVEKFLEIDVPEAIICANDAMALETMRILKKHGLRIPEDVLVTGFDGIKQGSWSNPDVTTCGIEFTEVAEKMFETLNQSLKGELLETEYDVPFELQLRGSCGCGKGENVLTSEMLFGLYEFNKDYEIYQKNMYNMQTVMSGKDNVIQLASVIHSYMIVDGCIVVDNSIREFAPGNKIALKKEDEVLPGEMRVLVSKRGNEIGIGTIFQRNELIPDLDELLTVENPIVVMPIHSAGNCFGYMAFSMHDDRVLFNKAVAFDYAIGNALEIFKNQKSLKQVNNKLAETNERMAELYIRDPLTKMFNRRGFYNTVKEMIQKCIEQDYELYVGSIDLDNLKGINDTYGHSEGDSALRTFANAMMVTMDEYSICARFGGDEFVVAGISKNAEESGKKYLANMNTYLDNYNKDSGKPYEVHASIGLVNGKPVPGTEIDEFILKADRIMYENKKQNKLFRSKVRTQTPERPVLMPEKRTPSEEEAE